MQAEEAGKMQAEKAGWGASNITQKYRRIPAKHRQEKRVGVQVA